MVHAQHAALADAAVVRAWRLVFIALLAKARRAALCMAQQAQRSAGMWAIHSGVRGPAAFAHAQGHAGACCCVNCTGAQLLRPQAVCGTLSTALRFVRCTQHPPC